MNGPGKNTADDEFRICEFFGRRTNAKLRGCCINGQLVDQNKGRATDILQLPYQIIASGFQGSIVITGGGTEAIPMLLDHGGGSAVLHSAFVPYSEQSLHQAFGHMGIRNVKCCSPEAAKMMASDVYGRMSATFYKEIWDAERGKREFPKYFGLAATASLAKRGKEREGRRHHCHIAWMNSVDKKMNVTSIEIVPDSRPIEEGYVANLIIIELAKAVGVDTTGLK